MLSEKLKIVSWNLGNSVSFKSDKSSISKKDILTNISNQIKVLKNINADFMLLQEITKISFVNLFSNPLLKFTDEFRDYNIGYVSNTDLSKILDHGNATLSNYDCESRKIIFPEKLNGVFNNLIFSNRSSLMTVIPMVNSSKKLIIFNIHFAPFKQNSEYRNRQIKYILNIAKSGLEKGNYIIIGGDFNIEFFDTKGSTEILKTYFDLINPIEWEIPFTNKLTFKNSTIIKRPDGLVTSKNIDINDIFVFDNCDYSDHYPIGLKFKLR